MSRWGLKQALDIEIDLVKYIIQSTLINLNGGHTNLLLYLFYELWDIILYPFEITIVSNTDLDLPKSETDCFTQLKRHYFKLKVKKVVS